jgi:hypothetical protein
MTRQWPPSPDHARIAWIVFDWAASACSTVLIMLVVAAVEKMT